MVFATADLPGIKVDRLVRLNGGPPHLQEVNKAKKKAYEYQKDPGSNW